MDNKYSHLTNTSINKLSPCTFSNYYIVLDSEKQDVGSGCKWTISQLKSYFEEKSNISFAKIWAKIKTIVLLTLLPVSQEIKSHTTGCFELYGFDILIDNDLKAWLLEINLSPALNTDTQIDIDVKRPLLEHMIDLIGLDESDGHQGMKHSEVC